MSLGNQLLTETVKIVQGLQPSADLYNGDPATDVVGMKGYSRVSFLLHAVATTGTAVVTVESCDNAAASNAAAMAFTYRKKTTGASAVWGAVTAATSSGFTTTASESTIYEISIEDQALPEGQPYVRLQLTEGVDAAVVGGVTVALYPARYAEPNMIDPLA